MNFMNILWIMHHINYLLLIALFNAFTARPLFCVEDMSMEWLGLELSMSHKEKGKSLPLYLFICICEWKMVVYCSDMELDLSNGEGAESVLAVCVQAWTAFLFQDIQ